MEMRLHMRLNIDVEARNRCFDHANVLYLMSNHAQTILHEIPLLEEPTYTPKLKFTVKKQVNTKTTHLFSSSK